MENNYVYIDFEGFKSKGEVKDYLMQRSRELNKQGFSKYEVIIILFEDSYFKKCFLSERLFFEIKKDVINNIENENTHQNYAIKRNNRI